MALSVASQVYWGTLQRPGWNIKHAIYSQNHYGQITNMDVYQAQFAISHA
jgi:hypothetical protein